MRDAVGNSSRNWRWSATSPESSPSPDNAACASPPWPRSSAWAPGTPPELPAVIASSEAGAAKPNAKIFHQGCTRLRLAPDEVAYVGDRLQTDAIAATNAGLHGIWLNRDNAPTPAEPPVIQTLEDLPALLTKVDR
jgi:beta-phosphoglucomutase-like phosphatase (HAD superfamily)